MITVKDIREKEFGKQKNGYSDAEVDDFLDEIADQMEALVRENRAMVQRIEELSRQAEAAPQSAPAAPSFAAPVEPAKPAAVEDSAYFRNLESTLRETLISAQRIADETVADARKKSNQKLSETEEKANALMASARMEVDAAKLELEELRKSIEDYRTRFLQMVEEQVHTLKADFSLFQ